MAIEWKPASRSVVDILERVLERGLLVTGWFRPTNLSVPKEQPRKGKARQWSRRTASRPPRK